MSGGLVEALSGSSVLSVELRPPRAELDAAAGRDAWIDTHHAVRSFVRQGSYVFLTDNAVGAREEHTLRHLVNNLGDDVPRERVVPFLTTKHTLDYCQAYAEQAWQAGFRSLVVLGGDKSVGPARCVGHAWQLRQIVREHVPALSLGGWANPHADAARQVDYLTDAHFTAEYFLTQVVSHHDLPAIERFLAEYDRRKVTLPGVFGVFYYRSASQKTLHTLQQFLPVPAEALATEFASGATPEAICARTLVALRNVGVKHVYLSNLPIARARITLERILALAAA